MEYGGNPAQTHQGGRTDPRQEWGSAVVGVQRLESSSRRGKPGGSLCHRTQQELGRPEEQFGAETTHGILPQ